MFKSIALATGIIIVATGLAQAACPSTVPGSTPEAIAANQQRIICLQEETRQGSQQRIYDMQLQTMQNNMRDLQLQRRLDSLPKFTPPPINPPVFKPN